MKRIRLAALLCALLLLLAGCAKAPEKPADTTLEFWIGDPVTETTFSGFTERYGLMGGREYYGTGYVPGVDEGGQQTDPEQKVIYTVTAFPDYSSGKHAVTRITITDPAVTVFGLNCSSAAEEWDAVFREMGWETEDLGNTGIARAAVKGKYRVVYGGGTLTISVEVTNRFGIVF